MTKFVVVPQWQGSGSSRAMQLIDGAEAIRGDLPTAATTLVHVPTEAGEALDTDIRRASSLVTTAELQRQALVGIDEPVITIGGDCGVELASVGEALRRDPGIAVVWFDAHGDLNTPLSSPSGSFSGMVARALTGEGAAMLLPEAPLDPARLVLVGVRDLDDGELAHVEERGIPMVSSVMTSAAEVVAAVETTGADRVYLHVDVDVLDPAVIAGVSSAVPFGLELGTLLDCITALRARFGFAGAGVTGFSPGSPDAAADDLGTILRIIGAISREPKPDSTNPTGVTP
ncbi:arginase [Plantibacter flavus]|uniref:Arginase n=1 Tax=Plantibacter flavus TaxID=150123 RepID=A0A3N2C476_9MICO|nr:arginase family protein [Plantibacter flavus]ROR82338.1 arginase [Plantibacter flavus]SMG43318.1 arginase [Plantibacter flavus]